MKRFIMPMLVFFAIFAFAGCMSVDELMNSEVATLPEDKTEAETSENNDDSFNYMREDLSKYCVLSDYEGLSVEIEKVVIDDETLESALDALKKRRGVEEIDDELAAEISDGKCTLAEEFSEYYRELLRENTYRTSALDGILNAVIESSSFSKLPESEVTSVYESIKFEYEAYALLMGIEYSDDDELFESCGTSSEEVMEAARTGVKEELVFYSIIKAEQLMFSDNDYDAVLTENAEYNLSEYPEILLSAGYDSATLENMKDYLDKNYSEQIIVGCFEAELCDFLIENNTVSEKE